MQKSSSNSFLPPLWILSLLFIVALGWLLFALKELVTLLIIGFAISYVIEPIIVFLERRKISRTTAFFMVLLSFILVVTLITITTWPTLAREGKNLVENLPHYAAQAQKRTLDVFDGLPVSVKAVIEVPFARLQEFGTKILPNIFGGLNSVLLGGYSMTLALVNLALLPFIVFYLTQSYPNLSRSFVNLFPRSKRASVGSVIDEVDTQVAAFIRGQLLVASILFVIYALGLGFIGVELWLVLAVIAGFGNLIPYVGTVLGVVLASVMALVTFGDFWHLLYVWILFAGAQIIEGSFITPRIIGESVGLHPLIIIFAIVAGGTLFGLLGVMLAVPMAAALKVLFRHGRAWLAEKVDG